jgi:hypothetical protein
VSGFQFLVRFTENEKLEAGNSSRLCGRFLRDFARELFENAAEAT